MRKVHRRLDVGDELNVLLGHVSPAVRFFAVPDVGDHRIPRPCISCKIAKQEETATAAATSTEQTAAMAVGGGDGESCGHR